METVHWIDPIAQFLKQAEGFLENPAGLKLKDVQTEVQERMSEHAGILCDQDNVRQALHAARSLSHRVAREGIHVSSPSQLSRAFRWSQMVRVSEAVLTALAHYIDHGGGSRGARAICTAAGTCCPEANALDLSEFRFREEQEKDRKEELVVTPTDKGFRVHAQPVDLTPDIKREFFERGWGPYLLKEG
jgi:succinate dehydrogenase/fumarate reductase flavoprotein subunit